MKHKMKTMFNCVLHCFKTIEWNLWSEVTEYIRVGRQMGEKKET